MKKALRTSKVLVDWSQNDEHKTTISVYSLRARERPTVSTPVSWEEVENALKKKDAGLLVFESHQTLKRIEKLGDLFAPLLSLKQKLPKLSGLGAAEPASAPEGFEMAAQARGRSRTPSGKSAAPAAGKRKPSRPSSARKPRRKL